MCIKKWLVRSHDQFIVIAPHFKVFCTPIPPSIPFIISALHTLAPANRNVNFVRLFVGRFAFILQKTVMEKQLMIMSGCVCVLMLVRRRCWGCSSPQCFDGFPRNSENSKRDKRLSQFRWRSREPSLKTPWGSLQPCSESIRSEGLWGRGVVEWWSFICESM